MALEIFLVVLIVQAEHRRFTALEASLSLPAGGGDGYYEAGEGVDQVDTEADFL